MNKKGILVTLATAVALAACAGGDSNGPSENGTGFLSLGVSDAPIHSAKKVCITFDDVELKPAGEDEPFLVDLPETKVNLLAFQGMNAAPLLVNEGVPAGEYEWMRLLIDASAGGNGGLGDDVMDLDNCTGDASYIVMDDDTVHNVWVPSGDQTGLKLVNGFTVPINGTADFTAEWDLMRSMVAPPGLAPDVILKPTIKLVNNADVGALMGNVSTDLTDVEGCEPSVFVFAEGIAPNPDDEVDDALATGIVDTDTNRYEIGFLLAGSYNVAFTCDGTTFEPEAGAPVTIGAGEIVELDFPVTAN